MGFAKSSTHPTDYPAAGRNSFQIGLSPNVAMKARCASRSASVTRGARGISRCRRGVSPTPLVMIECPRLLFPFAREIIATAVRDGGFPPLMLDPVDFVGLYRQNMERQAAAQAASGAKPS